MLNALTKLIAPRAEHAPTGPDRLSDLPIELFLEVARHLSPADLYRLSRTRKGYAFLREDSMFRDRYLTHPWYKANPQRKSEGKSYFERFRDQANYDLKCLRETARALGALSMPTTYVCARGHMSYAAMLINPAIQERKRSLKSQIIHWQRTVLVARGAWRIKT